MLSTGSSSTSKFIRQLSPCSEDNDNDSDKDEEIIPLDSNLWESLSNKALASRMSRENQITIKTKFDSNLPKNRDLICPRKGQRVDRFNFTLRERKSAEDAKVPSTIEDMQNMVSSVLSTLLLTLLLK